MAKEKKMTFEHALEKLETIVSEVEEGKVSLEESIDKYAEGTKLIKQCRAILEKAEQKIQILSKGQDSQLNVTEELEEQTEQE